MGRSGVDQYRRDGQHHHRERPELFVRRVPIARTGQHLGDRPRRDVGLSHQDGDLDRHGAGPAAALPEPHDLVNDQDRDHKDDESRDRVGGQGVTVPPAPEPGTGYNAAIAQRKAPGGQLIFVARCPAGLLMAVHAHAILRAPQGSSSLVSEGRRVSRPVGRVLCARSRGPAAIHLGLPLPTASSGLPASSGGQPSIARAGAHRQARSLLTLLRVGFTEPPRSPWALVVSYTTVSPLPPDESGGGLLSVALSRESPRVGVTDHPALRSPDLPRRASRC
jgi:hypothetical protein